VFIGIAEEFGLIEELGLFVLKRACHDAMQWPDVDGEAPFVSVNLSPRQLRQSDLASAWPGVARQPAGERAPAPRADRERADGRRAGLHGHADGTARLGARIWLDDFGTGFSACRTSSACPSTG
jgi:EAL domain-containing protein (putative c-di-GMP-specific phosphodiesterase class I)